MHERTLDIDTGEGLMETFICHPERSGPHPTVILLMDAPGIRDELRDMTRRLASAGYFVLLPNLYYRAGRDSTFGADVLDKESPEYTRMRAIRTKMTIPPVMRDFAKLLEFADGEEQAADQHCAFVRHEELGVRDRGLRNVLEHDAFTQGLLRRLARVVEQEPQQAPAHRRAHRLLRLLGSDHAGTLLAVQRSPMAT